MIVQAILAHVFSSLFEFSHRNKNYLQDLFCKAVLTAVAKSEDDHFICKRIFIYRPSLVA